ncbi:hypothetical protein ACH4SP_27890 [Streptomyces sp. NPDC021093]
MDTEKSLAAPELALQRPREAEAAPHSGISPDAPWRPGAGLGEIPPR